MKDKKVASKEEGKIQKKDQKQDQKKEEDISYKKGEVDWVLINLLI